MWPGVRSHLFVGYRPTLDVFVAERVDEARLGDQIVGPTQPSRCDDRVRPPLDEHREGPVGVGRGRDSFVDRSYHLADQSSPMRIEPPESSGAVVSCSRPTSERGSDLILIREEATPATR